MLLRRQRIRKDMSRALVLCVGEGQRIRKDMSRALVLCVGEGAENTQGHEQRFGVMCW